MTTASPHDPADQPDPNGPVLPDTDTDGDDQGDDDTDDDEEDPARSGAPIGASGTYELAQLAERLGIIGRSAHNEFGDRLVFLAEKVRDLAREARKRLAADRLPDDAGTVEQRQRRREAAADWEEAAAGVETSFDS
jgi:hypothetical protein